MDPILEEYKKVNQRIGFWTGVIAGLVLGAITILIIGTYLFNQQYL